MTSTLIKIYYNLRKNQDRLLEKPRVTSSKIIILFIYFIIILLLKLNMQTKFTKVRCAYTKKNDFSLEMMNSEFQLMASCSEKKN